MLYIGQFSNTTRKYIRKTSLGTWITQFSQYFDCYSETTVITTFQTHMVFIKPMQSKVEFSDLADVNISTYATIHDKFFIKPMKVRGIQCFE